jgi:hypothetical protein
MLQATAKVKRRSSRAQHNNHPTIKWGTAKVAKEKQGAHRSNDEEQQCTRQQPTSNYSR